MNNEVWKQITDYPNYFVSNTGKVRNVKTGRELSQVLANNGYLIVQLWKKGKGKTFLVHRLVAETFIDNPNNYDTVDHLNGIKTDNRAENFQWLSRSENIKRFMTKQITKEQKEHYTTVHRKNIENARKKIIDTHKKPVVCSEIGKIYESITQASKELNLNNGHINQVCRGERKTTGGLHFRYLLEDNDYE